MCWGFKLHSGDHQFSWGLRTSACTRKCLWAGWFAEPGGTIQPKFYHNSIELYFMTWFSTCLEYEEIKLFLAPHFRRWAAQHRAIHAVCAHHQARISTQKPPGVSPDCQFWASGVVLVPFYGYTDTPFFRFYGYTEICSPSVSGLEHVMPVPRKGAGLGNPGHLGWWRLWRCQGEKQKTLFLRLFGWLYGICQFFVSWYA